MQSSWLHMSWLALHYATGARASHVTALTGTIWKGIILEPLRHETWLKADVFCQGCMTAAFNRHGWTTREPNAGGRSQPWSPGHSPALRVVSLPEKNKTKTPKQTHKAKLNIHFDRKYFFLVVGTALQTQQGSERRQAGWNTSTNSKSPVKPHGLKD